MIARFQVWLAVLLCKGTGCVVTRRNRVDNLRGAARILAEYVGKSGGLQDPRRIVAYRTVLKASSVIGALTSDILVGPKREEKTDGEETIEEAAA